ncbi:MAG: FtsX-like permease family protein [Acidobacteriota bacterium]
MKAYFRLFRQFILRALARAPLRSAITALGISLGVGVMVAIRLANAGALESFRSATQSIAGETSIQITGAAGHFDEMLMADLAWLRDYGHVSPVVTGFGQWSVDESNGKQNEASSEGEFIQILGVDVLRDRALRQYKLLRMSSEDREVSAREFLLLLTDPRSIVLTEKFARRRRVEIGDRVTLTIGDARREFILRGLLADTGPARALDGRVALLDIAAAQVALGRAGFLDRIDVKLRGGISVEEAEKRIAARLPKELRVSRPDAAHGQIEKMISAFHFNLNALASIALLVGLFLIYNTVSVSVITRREEVGTLRAIGAGQRMILALFLGEAALLALAGAAFGLGIGRLLAGLAVQATATTVETFYIARAATNALERSSLGAPEALMAFGVALSLSLIAAAMPALEASRMRPIEAMRGAERCARSRRPSMRNIIAAIGLMTLGYILTRFDAIGGIPVTGYFATLSLILGGAALAPAALWTVCRIGALSWLRVFEAERKMAVANLRGSIPRISISVAALAVSLAMMTAISIMIASFRDTVSYWIDQTLTADIYVRPVARAASTAESAISEEAISAIKSNSNVAAVDTFTSLPVSYDDNPILVAAGDFSVLLERGRLLFKSPADAREDIRKSIGADSVLISESFALRFNKRPGDEILLPTPQGHHRFLVAAVYYNYSNTRGVAFMDRTMFERYFTRLGPSSVSIYLKEGADLETTSDELARAASHHQLLFTTNASVRGEIVRIFDNSFSITRALELIAITVAALGVISTLIALILERRAEIAVLRFLGSTRAQIRRMVVIESVLIGIVSQSIGVVTGLFTSLVLIYVINVQSFGWTIQFHFPVRFLIESTLLMIVVTAIAALYPASQAAKVEAVRFAREE